MYLILGLRMPISVFGQEQRLRYNLIIWLEYGINIKKMYPLKFWDTSAIWKFVLQINERFEIALTWKISASYQFA